MRYQWVTTTQANRSSVEAFICERYWLNFNACLSQLPEVLLALYENDTLVAACGIQFAEQKTQTILPVENAVGWVDLSGE